MIERAITTKDLNSRFYHHNLGLAEMWEAYSQTHNGEISGIVNGAIFEFELTFRIINSEIKINGIRQKSNVNAGSSTGYSMIKNTVISMTSKYSRGENWEIYKSNKLRDFLNGLIGTCIPYKGYPGYSISSTEKDLTRLNYLLDYSSLFELAEVRSISSRRTVIRIEYFTLLGIKSINTIMNVLENKL